MITYRTRDGDRLDIICATHYGTVTGTVEQVLQANPGLAAKGCVLPANIIITLPKVTRPLAQVDQIRLWQ